MKSQNREATVDINIIDDQTIGLRAAQSSVVLRFQNDLFLKILHDHHPSSTILKD